MLELLSSTPWALLGAMLNKLETHSYLQVVLKKYWNTTLPQLKWTTLHYATLRSRYSTFGNSTKTTVVTSIGTTHSKWEMAAMLLYILQQILSIQRLAKWARLTSIKIRPCEHEWAPQTECKVLAVSTSSPNRPMYSIKQETLDETYLGKVIAVTTKRT